MVPVGSVRQQMATSPIVFHLTGSRYFGNATAKSDWDFFTEYTENTQKFLANLGFVRLAFHGYNDELTAGVWRHAAEQIDVQLVRDVPLKIKIQEMIYADVGMLVTLRNVTKNEATAIWDFLYRLIGNVKRSSDHAGDPRNALPLVEPILQEFMKGKPIPF
jgi:hypothetical protein